MRDVVVLGAGMHPYGLYPEKSFVDMGVEACQLAFEDAGIDWSDVEVGYCASGRQTAFSGHAIARVLGTYGTTMTNVENASASGWRRVPPRWRGRKANDRFQGMGRAGRAR